MKKYRLCWENEIGGNSGHGNWFTSYDYVKAVEKNARNSATRTRHWIEEKEFSEAANDKN
jgi:hypothetical protein